MMLAWLQLYPSKGTLPTDHKAIIGGLLRYDSYQGWLQGRGGGQQDGKSISRGQQVASNHLAHQSSNRQRESR